MALLHLNFESQYLNNNHEISVILPDKPRDVSPKDFYGSGKKYKVLWLLHGTFGDHSDWIRKSNIELYACEKNLIVVMLSGLNANYANWKSFSIGYNMYDYLFDELMPLIYGWFPASPKREDNFIAGLSMGGQGTCIYAFNHPEKFAGAASLSYTPQEIEGLEEREPDLYPRTAGQMENVGGKENFIGSYEDIWALSDKLAKTGDYPKLYFTIGMDDFLYHSYLHYKKHAQEVGLKATFEEVPGYRHEWRFWDLAIQKALTFFGLDD